jgi:hypothetical protein
MKVMPLLLVGSLVANAVLFGLYQSRLAPKTGDSANAFAALLSPEAKIAAAAKAAAAAEVATKAADAVLWSTTGTEEFAPLVARLRAAGFPPHVIKVMLRVQMDEYFTARRKALLPHSEDAVPFWNLSRNAQWGPFSGDPKERAELQALMKEESKLANDLLGPGGDMISLMPEEYRLNLRRQYGNLPDDKLDQLQKIAAGYNDQRQELYSNLGPNMLPEDREKLTALEKAQRAEIAKALTPEELEDYDLRSSQTASQLRNRLAAFKPTEEEFRAIFKLQQALDEQLGGASATGPGDYATRQARQRELDAQIATTLGPDRATDYKLVSDPSLSMLGRIVGRFNLPSQAAFDVAAVQKDTMQRASALGSDSTLSPEQRSQQLMALAAEANGKVAQSLGARGFQAYQEYGGQWLQSLQRRANARPATPPKG